MKYLAIVVVVLIIVLVWINHAIEVNRGMVQGKPSSNVSKHEHQHGHQHSDEAKQSAAKTDKANDEVTTSSGLKYKDIKKGSGTEAKFGDTVQVHYTGYLTDGKKFDSSLDRGEPFEFAIGKGGVIEGWEEGIQGMKVGGKRKLVIPPHIGYGSSGNGPIPPNATLVFDVELLKITPFKK